MLRFRSAEQEVGGGFHVPVDYRGVALRCCRIRFVLAPRGRLVHELTDDLSTRHRRDADGDLATRPDPGSAESLRSWQPRWIHSVVATPQHWRL